MKLACEAKTYPGGQWRSGVLTDERAESRHGWPVVLLDDEPNVPRGPGDIHVVRLTTSAFNRDFVQAARRAGFSIVIPTSPTRT